MGAAREMTLSELVETLPESHTARKEYERLLRIEDDKLDAFQDACLRAGLEGSQYIKLRRELDYIPATVMSQYAQAWDDGYAAGVEDERISESNIGICGLGGKIQPHRNNPYSGKRSERVGNTPIDKLMQQYAAECCDFSDMSFLKSAALRYVSTMPDSQVRCLLYAFALQTKNEPECQSCDDSGDVHDMTGEWRGKCSCQKLASVDDFNELENFIWEYSGDVDLMKRWRRVRSDAERE